MTTHTLRDMGATLTDITAISSHRKFDMKSYIDTIKQASQQAALSRKLVHTAKPTDTWQPLETQIMRWWSNLPDSLRNRRFQLIEIAGVCQGRYRERPALRFVAGALRTLGWNEKRCWKLTGRNRRYWIPPLNTAPLSCINRLGG